MSETAKPFEEWALLELFGHQRIAGLVTESAIAGGKFLRVDVPDEHGNTAFSKFFNPSAIYAITPVDRQLAIGLAINIAAPPITPFDVGRLAKGPVQLEADYGDVPQEDEP